MQKRMADECRGGGEGSRGSMQKSLRLAKLWNMETPEPISGKSRGRYGEGESKRRRRIGGICKYFSNPRGKPRPSLFHLASRASIRLLWGSSSPPFLFFWIFFRFLSRAFHAAFFLLCHSIFLRICERKSREREREKKDERKNPVIAACSFSCFIYIASYASPRVIFLFAFPLFARVAFPDTRALGARRGWFSLGCYPLCIVRLECAVNASNAGISKLFLARDKESINFRMTI